MKKLMNDLKAFAVIMLIFCFAIAVVFYPLYGLYLLIISIAWTRTAAIIAFAIVLVALCVLVHLGFKSSFKHEQE